MTQPYIDSQFLADFRAYIGLQPQLQQLVGAPARFVVVLDANMAISDLLRKISHPHEKQTAIEEGIRSSALAVYAPRWLDEEMLSSAIPQVSARKGIPIEELGKLWLSYRENIIWDGEYVSLLETPSFEGDSKDIPYIELAARLDAAGILSRDRDIAKLGGKNLELDFVLSVRNYARAKSYQVTISVGGMMIGSFSLGALGEISRHARAVFVNLPDWAKLALFIGIVVAVLHPKSRESILSILKGVADISVEAWPAINSLILLAADKRKEADGALQMAADMLKAS